MMTGANALNQGARDIPDGYRLTELGLLPEEWRVVRLGEIFEIQQGKALSPKARSGNRKRPFLRAANVLWGRIDLTVLDEMHFEPSPFGNSAGVQPPSSGTSEPSNGLSSSPVTGGSPPPSFRPGAPTGTGGTAFIP